MRHQSPRGRYSSRSLALDNSPRVPCDDGGQKVHRGSERGEQREGDFTVSGVQEPKAGGRTLVIEARRRP
jgi:hypothetical protein